jgi:hypothetical protein
MHHGTDYSYALAASLGVLGRHEVSLTMGSDFDEYRRLMALARPDHAPGLPFDATIQDLHAGNALWIVGRDEDGTIMHTQALRLFDLGHRSLSDYLRWNFCAFRPSTVLIDEERSRYRPGPGAHRISGAVVYHGDVWLGGQPGRYRATGLSSILGRVAFTMAMRTWNPDHIFGFMANSVAQKGFPERQGYMHSEPHAINYAMADGSEALEGFMVYMAREDVRFILDLPLTEAKRIAA